MTTLRTFDPGQLGPTTPEVTPEVARAAAEAVAAHIRDVGEARRVLAMLGLTAVGA